MIVREGDGGHGAGTTGPALIPYPSTNAGELMILQLVARNYITITDPSGWTKFFNDDAGNMRGRMYYKVATGSESGNLSITLSGAASPWCGVISTFSGVDTSGTPYEALTYGAGFVTIGTTFSIPSITTTNDNAMCCSFGLLNDDDTLSDDGSLYAEQFEYGTTLGSDGGNTLYTYTKATAGVVAADSITITSAYGAIVTFALIPAAGYANKVNGIAAANIAKVNGVAIANIAKVNGV